MVHLKVKVVFVKTNLLSCPVTNIVLVRFVA